MAHIATDSDNLVVYAAPTAAMVTAWINAQGTPADYTAVDTGDVDLPALFGVDQWYWYSDAFHTRETAVAAMTLQLQGAARLQRQRICDYQFQLEEEAHFFNVREVNFARAFLPMLLWGQRRVFLSDDITNARKLGWVQQSANGPTDVDLSTADGQRDIFVTANSVVRPWTDTELIARQPKVGIIVCSTSSPYTRWALRDLVTNTGNETDLIDDPTSPEDIRKILTGEWINEISA